MSAFEIAQEHGFSGTEEEWLESVKGEKGDTGLQGAPGAAGANGLSAFEIAQEHGFSGTEEEWLESVKGEKGDTGLQGAPGAAGANGLSAFEIAQEHGFSGTEEEWLESVKGEKGDTGLQGDPGPAPSFVIEAEQLEYDRTPTADITEVPETPNLWRIALGIPKGEPGQPGPVPTIDVGEVTAVTFETRPTITKRETETGVIFDFDIPEGPQGLQGAPGAAGANGLSAFEIAQEHGFSGTEEEWLESVKGEKGDTGPRGEPGTFDKSDKLFTVVGPNDSADMYYGDNLVISSKTLDISVRPGSATVEIEKKSSDSEGYIIPFGTGYAAVAIPTTDSSGASVNIVNMGFGECGPGHALTSAGSGVFTINNLDAWYTFTMPKDAVLKGISMNVTNGVALSSGKATISPYVVIATAPPTSRSFTFVDETLTRGSESFLNGVSYPQYEKTVAGESPELNVLLTKGTQVSIVFGINTEAPGTMIQANYMICSGGLWFQ